MEAQETVRKALRASGLKSHEVARKTKLHEVTIRRFMARDFTAPLKPKQKRFPLSDENLAKVADLLGLTVEASYRVRRKKARV